MRGEPSTHAAEKKQQLVQMIKKLVATSFDSCCFPGDHVDDHA